MLHHNYNGVCMKEMRAFTLAEGATHVVKFKSLSKYGFTLAEVLITLGVIGVVAALTMPSVMNNVQKMVLKNQFKKSYSVITNAINKTSYDLGYIPACYGWISSKYNVVCSKKNAAGACIAYTTSDGSPLPSDTWGDTSECTVFYNQFIKEFNVIKTCNGNAYPECLPDYKGIDQINQSNYTTDPSDPNYVENYGELVTSGGCGGLKKRYIDNSKAFVTNDGMIIFGYSGYSMAVDVNGKKGPNKWGYDIFSLRMDVEGKGSPKIMRSECSTVDKGGSSATALIQNMSK